MLHPRKTADEICPCVSIIFAKQFLKWNYQVNQMGGKEGTKRESKKEKGKERKRERQESWETESYLYSQKKKKYK